MLLQLDGRMGRSSCYNMLRKVLHATGCYRHRLAVNVVLDTHARPLLISRAARRSQTGGSRNQQRRQLTRQSADNKP
jgi:hypothetical protein